MGGIVVIICIVVIGYLLLSANNIKLFKKREHKVKAKVSNEEKYKDVLPKEKKEKKPVKISSKVKDEKLKEDIKKQVFKKPETGTSSASTSKGKVSKVTKEDFIKNDIEVPSTSNLLTEEERNQKADKPQGSLKQSSPNPFDFGFSGFGGETKDFPLDEPGLPKDDDPFAGIDFDAILNGTGSSVKDEKAFTASDPIFDFDSFDGGFGMPSNKKSKTEVNQYSQLPSEDYFSDAPAFNMASQGNFQTSPVAIKSLEDRFEQVFGANYEAMGGTKLGKEVIIGDILSGPRAKINRLQRNEREKRKKWM